MNIIVARARGLVARGVRGVLWRRTAPLEVVVAPPKRVVRCVPPAARSRSHAPNAHAPRAAAAANGGDGGCRAHGPEGARLARIIHAITADTTSTVRYGTQP